MTPDTKDSAGLPEDLADAVRTQAGPGSSAHVAEGPEQRGAMDKLRELVTDFETDNDPLSRGEIEAARTVLRHGRRDPGGATT